MTVSVCMEGDGASETSGSAGHTGDMRRRTKDYRHLVWGGRRACHTELERRPETRPWRRKDETGMERRVPHGVEINNQADKSRWGIFPFPISPSRGRTSRGTSKGIIHTSGGDGKMEDEGVQNVQRRWKMQNEELVNWRDIGRHVIAGSLLPIDAREGLVALKVRCRAPLP